MEVGAGDAAGGSAEAELLAAGDWLAGFYVDAGQVHGVADETLAVVDHDAVAFVVEVLGEEDGACVSGEDGGAGGGAEVGALVDAGELAVEGAAGAEAVRQGSTGRVVDGGRKTSRPEGFVGFFGLGESLGFYFAVGFDFLLLFGAGFDEFGWDGDGGGVVAGGVDLDLLREVLGGGLAVSGRGAGGDFEGAGARWGFDVDAGEGEPGAGRSGRAEEFELAAEPFAFKLFGVGSLDADEFGGAGLDEGRGEGDGAGLFRGGRCGVVIAAGLGGEGECGGEEEQGDGAMPGFRVTECALAWFLWRPRRSMAREGGGFVVPTLSCGKDGAPGTRRVWM